MINSQDPDDTATCDCSVLNDEVLRDGCNNFRSLGWNNPTVDYEVVDCPPELTELPCWEDNGSNWPSTSPDLCTAPQTWWDGGYDTDTDDSDNTTDCDTAFADYVGSWSVADFVAGGGNGFYAGATTVIGADGTWTIDGYVDDGMAWWNQSQIMLKRQFEDSENHYGVLTDGQLVLTRESDGKTWTLTKE